MLELARDLSPAENLLRNDFPLFKRNPKLVYLDSASTSQKPQCVIDAISNFYETSNANAHRGVYKLSEKASELFEEARITISKYIGVLTSDQNLVFTRELQRV